MSGRISVDPWAYVTWAAMLLLIPLDWLFASCLAASIHELSHMAMICFLGGDIRSFRLLPGGASIETGPLDTAQELLCALAGPAGSFFLAVFCHALPKTAICGVLQGCFNLLPLYPLDGGRALRCGISLLKRKKPCKP